MGARHRQLVAVRVDDLRVFGVILDGLQIALHVAGTGIAVLGPERARLADDLVEAARTVDRLREGVARHTARVSRLAGRSGALCRVERHERPAVAVQQPVQDDAQRVKIGAEAVILTAQDLRRHVGIRALFRQAARAVLHRPRHAEIAELIVAVVGDEDIFQLDIAVDDAEFLAERQRPAQIGAELDHVTPRQRMGLRVGQDRVQQLHADEDIPADVVFVLDDLQLFAADDVARALELVHDDELVGDLPDPFGKVRLCLRAGRAVVELILQLRVRLRDADDLHRCAEGVPGLLALDLIDRAVAACAETAGHAPAVQHLRAHAVCFVFHRDSFLLFTARAPRER